MKTFNSGDSVRTTEYYNTQPYGSTPFKKGTVLEIVCNDGFPIASVSDESGRVLEIPVQFLMKI